MTPAQRGYYSLPAQSDSKNLGTVPPGLCISILPAGKNGVMLFISLCKTLGDVWLKQQPCSLRCHTHPCSKKFPAVHYINLLPIVVELPKIAVEGMTS